MLGLLSLILDAYSIVVLAAVICSWLSLPREHPIVRLVNGLTEPVLAPIRRALPPLAGLDFSPMILLFALQLVRRVVGV